MFIEVIDLGIVENGYKNKEQVHETAENMDVCASWRHGLRHRQRAAEGTAEGN